MKKIFLTLFAFLSFSVFGQMTISTDNMQEMPNTQRRDLSAALIMANGNLPRYGICNLDWIGSDAFNIKVYINDKAARPEILILSEIEWMRLRVDESMKRIVSGEGGRYVWQRINRGTILKPDFQNTMVITARANCLN